MVERRAAVLAADTTGDVEDIQNRLYDLQRYVSQHMNSDTGAIYLEQQYQRDSKKIIDAAGNTTNPNGNIYKKASDACDVQFSLYSQPYFQCYLSELEKYPAADNTPATVKLPATDLYRHDFSAPSWSSDFAGWSVFVCFILAMMIITRLVSLGILKAVLKRHYRSI